MLVVFHHIWHIIDKLGFIEHIIDFPILFLLFGNELFQIFSMFVVWLEIFLMQINWKQFCFYTNFVMSIDLLRALKKMKEAKNFGGKCIVQNGILEECWMLGFLVKKVLKSSESGRAQNKCVWSCFFLSITVWWSN